jgi:hypothetical protein
MIEMNLRWGTALLICVAGCTPPSLHGLQDPAPTVQQPEGPTVAQLVTHIQCEAQKAAVEANADKQLADLMQKGYVGEVSLTVDVVDAQGSSPTFSLIRNFTKVSNVTLGLSGQYSRSRHRNFNYYFPLKQVDHTTTVCAEAVDELKASQFKSGLSADLGLGSIFYTGLWARKHTTMTDLPPPGTGLQAQLNLGFSSQLDFTIIRGGAGGPTWTFASFKGPSASGGSGVAGGVPGLFSLNNTVKDTMVISFAPILTRPSVQAKVAKDKLDAATGAQQLELPAINSEIQSLLSVPLPHPELSDVPDAAATEIEQNIAAADHDLHTFAAPNVRAAALPRLDILKARARALAQSRDAAAQRLDDIVSEDKAGEEGAAYSAAEANLERFQLEQIQGLLHQ